MDCYLAVLRTCAPRGAYSGGGTARNCEAIGSQPDAARAPPRRPERRSNRPDSPRISSTIHYQTLFASKGSVW